jgi:hypothetical protein
MPGLVGGFGNFISSFMYFINNKGKEIITIFKLSNYFIIAKNSLNNLNNLNKQNLFLTELDKLNSLSISCYLGEEKNIYNNSNLRSYLAGLIEGDGTIAVHNKNTTSKKYIPHIIIVFKKADLPLAEFLKDITKCGKVYVKSNRGYVLWQIQNILHVFTITNLINGYMRTPKIEALHRVIN